MFVTLSVRPAVTPGELAAARTLCLDYRQHLIDQTRHLPGLVDHYYAAAPYGALVAALPGPHLPPDGVLLIGEGPEGIAGVGMTQRLGDGVCELKRVFVAPAARGQGLARAICQTALETARQQGYRRLVLDTMRVLTAAQVLYRGLGFADCPPYHDLPADLAPHVMFLGIDLD
jgi:putative acetyltransferase